MVSKRMRQSEELDFFRQAKRSCNYQNSQLISGEEDQKPKQKKTSCFVPHEIITDILSRVPVRTLMRFNCVCKSWRSLLNDRFFLKLLLDRSTRGNNLGFMIHNGQRFFKLDYASSSSSLKNPVEIISPSRLASEYNSSKASELNILASCDGIYLIEVSMGDRLYVWNPSTNEKKMLPRNFSKLQGGILLRNGYGLGYHSLLNDYKVVKISSGYPESDVGFYSIKANSSNHMRFSSKFILNPSKSVSGISLDGAIHFLGKELVSSLKIISFGIANEEFKDAEVPGFNITTSKELGILDECLCIYELTENYVEVFVMKEYGVRDSWTKIFTLKQPGCETVPEPTFNAVCATGNGKLVAQWNKRDLVVYDTTQGCREYQHIIHGVFGLMGYFHIETYVDSPVSLR